MSKVIWTPKKYKETWLHVSQIENKKTIQAAYSMRSLDPEKAKKWVKQTDEGMKINVGYINEFNAEFNISFQGSKNFQDSFNSNIICTFFKS